MLISIQRDNQAVRYTMRILQKLQCFHNQCEARYTDKTLKISISYQENNYNTV